MVSRFSVETSFCHRVPEHFEGENFCAVFQKISVSGKLYALERGVPSFSIETFCLTMPKTFAGEPSVLCFRKFPVAKTLWITTGGGYQDFVSLCRKLSQGNSFVLCFRKIPLVKNSVDKEQEVSRVSVEVFLSHYAENFRKETLLCCVSENFR